MGYELKIELSVRDLIEMAKDVDLKLEYDDAVDILDELQENLYDKATDLIGGKALEMDKTKDKE